MSRYTVVLTPEPEAGGFSVNVPALPGCVSEGDTEEEALANIREAIGLHLWGMIRDGDSVPPDVRPIVTTIEAQPIEGRPPTDDELAAIDNAPGWDGRTW